MILKTLLKKKKIKTSRIFTKMEKNMLSKDNYEGGKEGNKKGLNKRKNRNKKEERKRKESL